MSFSDMHQNNRTESFSSSSGSRRLSMPKSPDGKLSSPRLCLKFHRDNFGYTNQKSRDSNEPQYKSYSVTNMSVDSNIDTPMFSPSDSPASSVDSDLYNPGLDSLTNFSGSKLKISLPEDDTLRFDSKSNLMIPALRLDGNSLNDVKEVFPEKDNYVADQNDHNTNVGTTSDSNSSKSVLKHLETSPFKPNSQWSESQTEDSMDLPDLEIDTSDSIPTDSHKNNGISDFTQECNSVSSSSVKSPGLSGVNHSSVTSSTEFNEQQELSNSGAELIGSNTLVTSNSDDNCLKQSDERDDQSENLTEKVTELSSTTVTSAESTDSCLCPMTSSTDEDSDKLNILVPCSPNRTERDSKDSRPSTPKVPPLKIIIPAKSQAISTPTHTHERLKVGTKSALPYVINPYQDQDRETDTLSAETGVLQENANTSTHIQPVQNCTDSDITSNSDNNYVMNTDQRERDKNSDENVDMEVDYSDVNSGKPSQDNVLDDKEEDISKSDSELKKEETKKDEPTQRVLRSAVRSQQLSTENKPSKQQKQLDKTERSSKYIYAYILYDCNIANIPVLKIAACMIVTASKKPYVAS